MSASCKTVTLLHPAMPGVELTIRPGLLRRLGLRTSAFATAGETWRYLATRPAVTEQRDSLVEPQVLNFVYVDG